MKPQPRSAGLRNWRLSYAQIDQQKSQWLFSAWRHWLTQGDEGWAQLPVTETGKKLEWQVARQSPFPKVKGQQWRKGRLPCPETALTGLSAALCEVWVLQSWDRSRTLAQGSSACPHHPAGTHFLNGHCHKMPWEKLHDTSLPTLSPNLTRSSDTAQKAQMSTALTAWLAPHLGNRLVTLWHMLL